MCIWVPAEARRRQLWTPLELEWQVVVKYLTWILGAESELFPITTSLSPSSQPAPTEPCLWFSGTRKGTSNN